MWQFIRLVLFQVQGLLTVCKILCRHVSRLEHGCRFARLFALVVNHRGRQCGVKQSLLHHLGASEMIRVSTRRERSCTRVRACNSVAVVVFFVEERRGQPLVCRKMGKKRGNILVTTPQVIAKRRMMHGEQSGFRRRRRATADLTPWTVKLASTPTDRHLINQVYKVQICNLCQLQRVVAWPNASVARR
jgi:hypothetical protein